MTEEQIAAEARDMKQGAIETWSAKVVVDDPVLRVNLKSRDKVHFYCISILIRKINRSHTHTHTPTENNTPDTDTHIHDKKNTPNPQTNTLHKHLLLLEEELDSSTG